MEDDDVIWRKWLPPAVATAAAEHDAKRFNLLLNTVNEQWVHLRGTTDGPSKTKPWMHPLWHLWNTKAKLADQDVVDAAELMLDIIIHSRNDLIVRASWAKFLSGLLHRNRRILCAWRGPQEEPFTVEWRPLLDMLLSLPEDMKLMSIGLSQLQEYVSAMRNLFEDCRRYFPTGAAAEIWDHFEGSLERAPAAPAFESLGCLVLLLPTYALRPDRGVAHGQVHGVEEVWRRVLPAIARAWALVPHCREWDAMCLMLLASCAKHDVTGIMPWQQYRAVLLTQCLGTFRLPVGTSSATPPSSTPVPSVLLQQLDQGMGSPSELVARLLVYTLGRDPRSEQQDGSPAGAPGPPPGHPESELPLLDRYHEDAEQLLTTLLPYFHPSNGGSWSQELASLLEALYETVHARRKDEAVCTSFPGPQVPLPLGGPSLERFLGTVVALASKAQYSKTEKLRYAGVNALCMCAEIVPDTAVPLIAQRFKASLDAVSSPHQLVSSINALACCARTMLTDGMSVGFPSSEDAMEAPSRQQQAREYIAEALMATLPGLDANDARKSQAVLNLYVVVLSSVVKLTGVDSELTGDERPALPFEVDVWVQQFLERLFHMMRSMDQPSDAPQTHHDGSRGATRDWALGQRSHTEIALQLLFSRLLSASCRRAVRLVGRFVLGSQLQATKTAYSLVAAAASADPKGAVQHIFLPLLEQIQDEIPAIRAAAPPGLALGEFGGSQQQPGGAPKAVELSKALETALSWQLSLLAACGAGLGPHMLTLQPQLLTTLDAMLVASTAMPVRRVAHVVMTALISSLASCYVVNAFQPSSVPGVTIGGCQIEPWWDKKAPKLPNALKWHEPRESEVAFVKVMVQRYLWGPLRQLRDMLPGPLDKDLVRILLRSIHTLLYALGCAMPDWQYATPQGGLPGASVVVEGRSYVEVAEVGARETVAETLLQLLKHVGPDDQETLRLVINIAAHLVSHGHTEHEVERYANDCCNRFKDLVIEAGVAAERLRSAGAPYDGPWGAPRKPLWLLSARVTATLHARACEHANHWFLTTEVMDLPLQYLPASYLRLVGVLQRYSLFPYQAVREVAVSGLRNAVKRYTCLAAPSAACAMAALAGCMDFHKVLPEPQFLYQPEGYTEAFLKQLMSQAMSPPPLSEATANGSSLIATAACLGGAQLLSDKNCMPENFEMTGVACFGAALIACRRHQGLDEQKQVMVLSMVWLMGLARPPQVLQLLRSPEPSHLPEPLAFLLSSLRTLTSSSGPSLPKGGVPALPPPNNPKGARTDPSLQPTPHSNTHPPLPPRYCVFAEALTQMLGPGGSLQEAQDCAEHLLQKLQSDVLSERLMAAAGVTLLAKGIAQPWSIAALRNAVQGVADGTGGQLYFKQLLAKLAAGHHSNLTAAGEAAQGLSALRQSMMAMGKDQLLAVAYTSASRQLTTWPAPEAQLPAATDGSFLTSHAELLQIMANCSPGPVLTALLPLLTHLLQTPPDSPAPASSLEKGQAAAAAEALTAVLGCPATYAAAGDGPGTPWDRWVGPLLRQVVTSTANEHAAIWQAAICYALHMLMRDEGVGSAQEQSGPHEAVHAVLDAIATPLPTGCPSWMVQRRLRLLQQVLHQLAYWQATEGVAPLHTRGRSKEQLQQLQRAGGGFVTQVLSELPMLMKLPGQASRAPVAGVLISLAAMLRTPDLHLPAPSTPSTNGSLSPLENDVEMVDANKATASERSGTRGETAVSADSQIVQAVAAHEMHAAAQQLEQLLQQVQRQLHAGVQVMLNYNSAANGVTSATPATMSASASVRPLGRTAVVPLTTEDSKVLAESSSAVGKTHLPSEGGHTRQLENAVEDVALGVEVVTLALKSGNGLKLLDIVHNTLPDILLLQDLSLPLAQALLLDAKKALIHIKHQGVYTVRDLRRGLTTLSDAASSPLYYWRRGAVLVVCQVVAFRNQMLLGTDGRQQLLDIVLGRLTDVKQEVREAACAMLAGVLNSLPAKEADAARQKLLADAALHFPQASGAGKRRRRRSNPQTDAASGQLPARHGAALGLKAIVLSSPYDIPAWLPPVLSAAAALCSEPVPYKLAAASALSEFRRTHEEAELAAMRETMSPEQWDAMFDAASPAAYFV